ncbi:hypothetical protein [Vibrio parahaemolyticus]|uniref:hypothetical protein n=1 Tax=Vibrio parahaemolyticus TaxID=670 RepID=UPI00177B89CF|nr:hypothetical protein [Vibrio parahaemolyticus]MBD6964792.1 hypothetical protein [Vibrio parahaemolyticus]
MRFLICVLVFLGIQGCDVESDDDDVHIPPTFCGVVYQNNEYVVNHHPYSINYTENGSDIDDDYCVSRMFKTYSYIDDVLNLNTEIREGDINEFDKYITLAIKFGYKIETPNEFSLLGQAISNDYYKNEFGWDLVENNITLNTDIGEVEIYQSVALDEQGVLYYSFSSSDGQTGRYEISTNDALLFFYGGENAFDAMSNIEYFESLF